LSKDFDFNPYSSPAVKDTAGFREVFNNPAIRRYFPADAKLLFGIPERDHETGRKLKVMRVWLIKTKGKDKAPIEGDVISSASMVYRQNSNEPSVTMNMKGSGPAKWETLTETSYNEKRPIAIVLDNLVYSAPIANDGKIPGGSTSITGSFTPEEATDLPTYSKQVDFLLLPRSLQSNLLVQRLDRTRSAVVSWPS